VFSTALLTSKTSRCIRLLTTDRSNHSPFVWPWRLQMRAMLMCPGPVCVPDDGCFSECCRLRGRAASTPALWLPERPHWLLPYGAMLGDQTAQACSAEPIGPALKTRSAAPQSPGDFAHTLPAGTAQDDIGAARPRNAPCANAGRRVSSRRSGA
jgi:hypothetical protein